MIRRWLNRRDARRLAHTLLVGWAQGLRFGPGPTFRQVGSPPPDGMRARGRHRAGRRRVLARQTGGAV
jgi:hypothetical protein